jgi:hypothetical protein
MITQILIDMKATKFFALRLFTLCLMMLCLVPSCTKEKDVIYGLIDQDVIPPNARKKKLKSDSQYVAILYVNMFQRALSYNQLVSIGRVIQSIGDRFLAYELLVSNMMNEQDIIFPTYNEMVADFDFFINESYNRFFIRDATELEMEWWRNYLQNNPQVTPEHVYVAFAISDEYNFY